MSLAREAIPAPGAAFARRCRSLDEARAYRWILALAAVLILAGLGLRDPWPADEPRFAQVAREMVESGRWLFPTRGGELYSDKPPLFMWVIAALYSLTGNLRVSFLLPSALAALGTLALVRDLARRWWDVRVANRAALLLLATLQFVLQSKSAQIDMMVTFWITLGAWGLLRHLVRVAPQRSDSLAGARVGTDAAATSRASYHAYLLGWFAMGLGVITKGVGFLPMLLLVPWCALLVAGQDHDARATLARPSIALIAGIPPFVAAIALWLVPMLLAVGDDPSLGAYRDDILFRQTGERYTDSWTHRSPWYYFLVSVIPLLWLPTTLLLPALASPWMAAARRRDPRVLLPLAWIALVVLFFSASPGKRGVYVLPCVPMLALAAAPFLDEALSRRWVAPASRLLLSLLAVLFLGAGVVGLLGLEAARAAELREGIHPWSLSVAIGLVAGLAAWLCTRTRVPLAWFAFVVPTWLLYSSWGYLIANEGRTPANVYRGVEQALVAAGRSTDIELALVDFREQYLLFSPYPLTHFGFATPLEAELAEAWRWVGEAPDRYLLLADGYPLTCYRPERALAVGRAHSRDWRLYDASARTEHCAAPGATVPRFHYAQDGALPVRRGR